MAVSLKLEDCFSVDHEYPIQMEEDWQYQWLEASRQYDSQPWIVRILSHVCMFVNSKLTHHRGMARSSRYDLERLRVYISCYQTHGPLLRCEIDGMRSTR